MRFLSADWCACLSERLHGTGAVSHGADARLQYEYVDAVDVQTSASFQVIKDGLVCRCEAGRLADPDAVIRTRTADMFSVLSGALTGVEAAHTITMLEERPTGTYLGPLPPLDFIAEPELARMPRLPGADLMVHYELAAAPFGLGRVSMIFRDGRLAAMAAGWAGEGDVTVTFPYRDLMLIRQGTLSWQDALQHGGISGSIDTMIYLAAIVESPYYQAAASKASARRAPLALATLGETMASEDYRFALSELLAVTDYEPHQVTRVTS